MISFNKEITIASYFFLQKNNNTYKLLTDGHAEYYPLSFEMQPQKKIIEGELNFFNNIIYENYNSTNHIESNQYQTQYEIVTKPSLVIYNCLDNCFGHALLKLFYFTSIQHTQLLQHDVLLIVPKSLAHFIKPSKGIQLLIINLSYKELEKCNILNSAFNHLLEFYQFILILPSSTYKQVSHQQIRQTLQLDNSLIYQKPCVVFYYRKEKDRSWASLLQHKKVTRLFSVLKPYFNSVDFILLGDKDKHQFDNSIIDKRIASFTKETDFEYNAILKQALITIGVTGSHMLFPSILSKQTIHLIPTYKLKNLAEDIVFENTDYSMPQYYKHLFYTGNYDLNNLSANDLAVYILNHFTGLIEKEYKYNPNNQSQKEWIAQHYPQFNYQLFYTQKLQFAIQAYKKAKWRLLFNKFMYEKN